MKTREERKALRQAKKLEKKSKKLEEKVDTMVEPDVTVTKSEKSQAFKSQKVECVETGEVFNSMKEASEKTGISATSISRSCKENKSVKGFTFVKV